MAVNSVKQFLREQLIEKIDHLTVYNEIATAVASTGDLETILVEVIRRLGRLVSFDRCEVQLIADGLASRVYVFEGEDRALVRVDRDVTVVGWCAERVAREGVLHLLQDDDGGEESFPDDRRLCDEGYRSIIRTPVRTENEICGCLTLASRTPGLYRITNGYSLEHVACQIACAVRQARLVSELQSTRDHLARLIENAGEAIAAVDGALKVNTWNRRSVEIFGADPQEALRVALEGADYLSGKRFTMEDLFRHVASTGEEQHVLAQRQLPEGLVMTLDISVSPIVDTEGRLIGALSVTRDVTEQRHLQNQLLQTKKLATMGELISGITHELNNKLAPILGYAQLIHRRVGDEDRKLSTMLDRVEEAAISAKRVIESLLAFARPQKNRLECVQINDVIRTTIELVRFQLEKEDVTIRSILDTSLPMTMADGHQISQVLLNLLNNAAHAMRGRDWKVVTIRTGNHDGRIGITVNDTGPGIPPDSLERIFDPFFSTKQVGEGTGLGLSVSFGIIQAHNGTIRAGNLPEGGASFVVELPIVEERSAPVEAAPAETEAEAPPSHILIVDDDQFLRDLLRDVLKRDHEIHTADSGYEAVQLLKGQSFDAIILDLRMPGMNGMDLFAWLRREMPKLTERVIFITGDTFDSRVDRFLRECRRPCLSKPFRLNELKQVLDHEINRQQRGTPGLNQARSA